jgi:DNA-binding Lrp family transcriptional regulator
MADPAPLDAIDRRLLLLLQEDGRRSNKELAGLVGLAPSSCHARLERLFREGHLCGVHAEVRARSLGVGLETLVQVRLADHGEKHGRPVIEFLRGLPEVLDLYLVAGQVDLVVHVAVRDTDHLRAVVFDRIGARPEVADVNTALIYEHHRAAGYPDLLGAQLPSGRSDSSAAPVDRGAGPAKAAARAAARPALGRGRRSGGTGDGAARAARSQRRSSP